jgi:hypothetical protein
MLQPKNMGLKKRFMSILGFANNEEQSQCAEFEFDVRTILVFVNLITDDAFYCCSPTGGPAASGGSRKFQRVVDGLELQHWLEKRKRNHHG